MAMSLDTVSIREATYREFFDNSIKLLGVLVLYMDVLYKAPKKLKRINKQPLLKGLVTVMNECRQICQQFFIPTDAHDLYETPLTEMKNTLDQCGHMGPRLAYTDNPSRDYAFLLKKSHLCKQDKKRTTEWSKLPTKKGQKH